MGCIFCAIAQGEIPSASIHEDGHTVAFLDIGPLTRGHALVIPKAHASRIEDCPPDSWAAVNSAVQHLLPKILKAAQAQDATVAINNGPDAGQEVPHLHVHIVPRRPGDAGGPIHALFAKRPEVDQDELMEMAAAIKEAA